MDTANTPTAVTEDTQHMVHTPDTEVMGTVTAMAMATWGQALPDSCKICLPRNTSKI
jgi:hypothetical protein